MGFPAGEAERMVQALFTRAQYRMGNDRLGDFSPFIVLSRTAVLGRGSCVWWLLERVSLRV